MRGRREARRREGQLPGRREGLGEDREGGGRGDVVREGTGRYGGAERVDECWADRAVGFFPPPPSTTRGETNTNDDGDDRYTSAKRLLLANTSMQDDVKTHMLSSLIAGTVATTICAPADVLKSRIQSGGGGGSSLLQVLSLGLKQEGPLFLMKGWTPAWLRLT